jgi:hypothetical protein
VGISGGSTINLMQRRFRLFKKQYVLPHKRKAHKVKRVHKHPAFFVPAITFGVLLTAGVVVLLIINKGDPTPQLAISNSRVVIVTVNGEERVVPTRANSVGELFMKVMW